MIQLDDLRTMPKYSNEWTDTQKITDSAFTKQLREKLGLSQKLFARVLGLSEKTIEKWEQGKNPIKGTASRLLYLLNRHPWLVKEIYKFKKDDKVILPETDSAPFEIQFTAKIELHGNFSKHLDNFIKDFNDTQKNTDQWIPKEVDRNYFA